MKTLTTSQTQESRVPHGAPRSGVSDQVVSSDVQSPQTNEDLDLLATEIRRDAKKNSMKFLLRSNVGIDGE